MFCPLEARLDAMTLPYIFNVQWNNNIKVDLTELTQCNGYATD